MWETVRASQIVREMKRYKLTMIGIREIHWMQAGQQRFDTVLLYASVFSSRRRKCFAHSRICSDYNQQSTYCNYGMEIYRFRMIKASSTTKKENVIQCCAPINDSNDDDNDQVYERLTKRPDNPDYRSRHQGRNGQHRRLTISSQRRRNYSGAQSDRDQTSTNFNMSGVLCRNIHRHNECISMQTLFWIQELKKANNNNNNNKTEIKKSGARAEKVKARAEYVGANKQVERSIGAD
ncbi:unnamed protein product [Schistosoma margrebowiei]|uniref:Uncharacterized protein n=1 Tax=Schistosoma margrebowiei TaxID=48269 RepID=A0A183NCI3_9TREM|nr:unnamed protein product [Schistosoma margrebowiei]